MMNQNELFDNLEVTTASKKALLDRMGEPNINRLIAQVERWHEDRNLIDGATDKDQVCKLIQEVGELSDNV